MNNKQREGKKSIGARETMEGELWITFGAKY
jgi:hypothetical protein